MYRRSADLAVKLNERTPASKLGSETAPVPDEQRYVWREAHPTAYCDDAYRRARRRRTILIMVAITLIVAEIVGVLFWLAASHYSRGKDAYASGMYEVAADEFAAARVIVFPYADAAAMEAAARTELARQAADARAAVHARAELRGLLRETTAKVAAGDASGVLMLLTNAQVRITDDLAHGRIPAQRTFATLEERLSTASRAALVKSRWRSAGLYAGALLVLTPSSREGQTLSASAHVGAALQAKLTKAADAARAHRWKTALALALAVLRGHPGFPGAATIVHKARVALTPKPVPAPAPAPPVAAAAPRVTVQPPAPSAPQPPPP